MTTWIGGNKSFSVANESQIENDDMLHLSRIQFSVEIKFNFETNHLSSFKDLGNLFRIQRNVLDSVYRFELEQ